MRSANIQLLRAFAAAGVLLHHLGFYAQMPAVHGAGPGPLWPLRWSAFVALPVPLFFAISGFVLAGAFESAEARDPQAGRAARAGRFLLARALRLYPGYWLAAVLARLWQSAGHLGAGAPSTPLGFGAALALAPAGVGPGYALGVEWTLVYELFLSLALGLLGLLGARALPWCAAAWLALLVAKAVVWPGLGSELFPEGAAIALSGFNAPFLGGVIAHSLRRIAPRPGRPVLGAVALAAVGMWSLLGEIRTTPEQFWLAATVPAGLAVWLAVRLPQAASDNKIVKLGDDTYGLYLVHVPLLLAGFELWGRLGLPPGAVAGTVAVGLFALAVGLAFGRLEAALHARLRRLGRAAG